MRHTPMPRAVEFFFTRIMLAIFAITCTGPMSGCATPGVTQGTGRVLDPPLELFLYCLLNPTNPACRTVLR